MPTGRVVCLFRGAGGDIAIRNLIRQSKTTSLFGDAGGWIVRHADHGSGPAKLVKDGLITESIAYDRSSNEEDLRNHLNT